MDFGIIWEYRNYFIAGTGYTLLLSFLSVIFGLVIGALLALMKISDNKILKGFATSYIEFVRGTPLLVQLYIVYYGLADMPMLLAGVIAMSINSAAYVAEIIRAGINAVDHGQLEAARSLGMNKRMAFVEIILPQAFKNILPALGNEFVVLIKESAIVSVIGLHDLMYNADTVRGVTYKPYEPLIAVAVIYFLLTFTLSRGIGRLERRMKVSD